MGVYELWAFGAGCFGGVLGVEGLVGEGFSGGRVCVIEVEMRTGRLVVRRIGTCVFFRVHSPIYKNCEP